MPNLLGEGFDTSFKQWLNSSLPLHGGRSGPRCPTAPDGLGWG